MKLADRIAIVTGSTSGIGKAIAIAFGREGANVVVTGRDSERLAAAADAVSGTGVECLPVRADLSKISGIDEVADKAVARFGRVDILVNAAGIYELAPFLECTEEMYDRTMNTNQKSFFFMAQRAAKEMTKQGRGKIINLTSVGGGTVYFPSGAVYCMTKAAGVALTKVLASELAPHKINVNCISPGNIRTPMNKRLDDPEILETTLRYIPWNRLGEVEDIAPIAVYLASDESDYVTGEQFVIDGGMSVHLLKPEGIPESLG